MQTEEQCKPSQRFLFANEYFSDKAINIWKNECVKRFKEKTKGLAYEKFINWTRQENEIAIFTLYAYADFDVPKKFDIIFHLENPKEFIQIEYYLKQSIYEAWYPIDTISHGHKHLCIFSFDKSLPKILNFLHKSEENFSTLSREQKSLGFCSSSNFNAITKRIEQTLELKKLYSDNWWEYDKDDE